MDTTIHDRVSGVGFKSQFGATILFTIYTQYGNLI